MRHYKSLIFFLSLSFLSVPLYASAETIPLMIPHTGTIKVNGTPFNGMGQFKFAITNGHSECATSPPGSLCKFHWTNDNRSPNGTGEPENFVTIFVNNGIFAVRLGDTTLTHMQTIPTAVFENAATHLRVWFNDGAKGSQWLSPDRPLAAVPYAYHAETAKNVVNGGVTSTMIANDAVTTTQIADKTIGINDLNFDPATSGELTTHKGGGDHDSRYLLKNGDTMTGVLSLNAKLHIGTTSPSLLGRLQVNNPTDDTNAYFLIQKNDGGSAEGFIINDDRGFAGVNSGKSLVVRTRDDGLNDTGAIADFRTIGGSDASKLYVGINGNVGIGTTTPISPLHAVGGLVMNQGYIRTAVFNATHPAVQFKGTSSPKSGFIGYDSQATGSNSEAMRFWVGGTTDDVLNATLAMSIKANGNVGIGTQTPEEQLDVVGVVRAGYVRIAPQNTTSEGGELSLIGAGANPNLQIDNLDGHLRIHTVQAGKSFHIIGTPNVAFYDGDSNWDFLSDARLKTGIEDAESLLARVIDLKVRRFDYKDMDPRKYKELGFIAQEVQGLFPDLITVGNHPSIGDDALSLAYTTFGVIAIKAIQEQQVIVNDLNARLSALEAELAALKRR